MALVVAVQLATIVSLDRLSPATAVDNTDLRVRGGFDSSRLAKSVEQAREFAEFNRFHEVRVKTYGARALMIRGLSVTRHRDEPNPAARSKVARELVAVHYRQPDVEHADSRGKLIGNV